MAPSKRWLFGGIAAAIALFLIGFMLLVNPARNQAADIQARADSVNEDNARMSAKLAQLQQQATEVTAKLEEIEAVEKKMPSEMEQADLIRSIEQEAQSAGVDLTGIAPGTPVSLEESSTGTIALPMAITAEGRYANVKTFVDNLERLERAFLIRTVEVTSSDEATGSFTLNLEGDFFSLPAGTLDTPESATAAPEPQPAASAAAKTPSKSHVGQADPQKSKLSNKSSKPHG